VRSLFEDYVLDVDRRELSRGGKPLPVEPKVFDLLAFLIDNRERVVSKDDLIASVWKGRVVSEAALTTCINAARSVIGDSGRAQRLIKTLPRKGFRFVGSVHESHDLIVPDKPSIAVLPFTNLSSDATQEYFAQGVVEEVITTLSRMRWLFVIARSSSFTYSSQTTDVHQVGRQLGVRYVLQGSVRKGAKSVRISAQLIEAASSVHLWSGRFEGLMDDIFDLQDQLAASVVGAIAPELQRAEIERARRKPTNSLDAYDHFLRGIALEGLAEGLEQRTSEGTSKALKEFQDAISIDQTFAPAHGMAALCYAQRKAFGWMDEAQQQVYEAARLARRAIETGADDAVALGTGGYVLAFVAHELEAGAASVKRALTLNPNFAAGWLYSGWIKIWLGQPDEAVNDLLRAMRLSPLGRGIAGLQAAIAHAHFFAGRHDEAASCALAALREHPYSHPGLRIAVASQAAAGKMDEAKSSAARLRQLDPTITIAKLRKFLGPYQRDALAKYEAAFGKAGV
jgi:TolB-like protein/Tfp pilus assembly protein PilF